MSVSSDNTSKHSIAKYMRRFSVTHSQVLLGYVETIRRPFQHVGGA